MTAGALGLVGAASAWADGKTVYETNCVACHGSGVAGAPKMGDAAAWAPRIKAGQAALYESAIKGKKGMPAKGGNPAIPDADVKAAVDYMVAQSGGKGGAGKAAEKAPDKAPEKPAAPAKAAEAAPAVDGKAVYGKACAACHGSGAAGAPKLGDAAAWGPRIKAGQAALYESALKGKKAMPPKGGNPALPDAEVKAAVDYMVAAAGGKGGGEKSAEQPVEKAPEAPAPKEAAAAPKPTAPEKAAEAPKPAPAPTQVAAAKPAAAPISPAAEVNAFNRLLKPVGKRNLPPTQDGIHDPANDGTQLLQPPMEAFKILPRSPGGNGVDWVQALESNKIAPRYDKADPKAEPVVMDLNIVREVKGSMPDVVYPHKQHTEWLDCSNCHPAIFVPQKGANQISMAAILLGQKCGVCHGKVAFPVSECRLCHSKKKDTITTGAAK
jgi:c(7)-type cytochrome triheme protein